MFSKHDEFQHSIDIIQRDYVSQPGWPAECFVERWPHILKPEHEHLNVPEVARHAVEEWEERHRSSFPWHYWRGIRSSRNLHSSQVLCLTLFGAFKGKHRHLLEQALLSAGLLQPDEVILESEFEYEPPNAFCESRRTSVDFMVRVSRYGEMGRPIYFEVKFLESHFGRCSRRSKGICSGFPKLPVQQIPTECLLTKEGIRYWELLPELTHSGYTRLGCPIEGPFYQPARNILHLVHERGRAFVVLLDARTKYLEGEVMRFVSFLSPSYRNLVRCMRLQELLPYLRDADISVAELLKRKYGIH